MARRRKAGKGARPQAPERHVRRRPRRRPLGEAAALHLKRMADLPEAEAPPPPDLAIRPPQD